MNKTKLTIFLAIIFLALFGMAGVASAAEYYVSPTGAAAWANCGGSTPLNGALACSWQTAMANAVAGDMVYFRGGVYNLGIFDGERGAIAENTKMFPVNSGIFGNPITFIAYPNETPDITGTVNTTSQEVWFGCGYTGQERNYITWDGFSATLIKNQGTFETGVFRVAGDHCTVRNMHFTGVDVGNEPYNTAFIRVQDATNALIENNYLHDLVSASYTAVNTAAIYFHMHTNLSIVRNNTILNSEGGVYGKGNSANVTIYNNFIYNNSGTCDRGIWYTRSSTGGETATTRIVYQNIIVGCNLGIWYEWNSNLTEVIGSLIYNNTIYSASGSDDGIYIDHTFTDTKVFNNLIVGRNPYLRYDDNAVISWPNKAVSYSDYNLFYNSLTNGFNCNYGHGGILYSSIANWIDSGTSCRPVDYDDNSLTSNPNFINPGGSAPADYKRTSYPMDGRGGSHASVIGAYITGDEIIGYVAPTAPDTTPPSAPTGLAVL